MNTPPSLLICVAKSLVQNCKYKYKYNKIKQKYKYKYNQIKIESPLAQSTISPHLHCESRGAVIAGSWDDTCAAGALHTSHMTYPSSQPHQLRHHHHHAYKFTIYSIQHRFFILSSKLMSFHNLII